MSLSQFSRKPLVTAEQGVQPPPLKLALSEVARSARETFLLARRFKALLKTAPKGDGHAVITLPGYGAGDGSLAVLRFFLRRLGYDAKPLDLGTNYEPPHERIRCVDDAIAFRQKMAEQVCHRLNDIHQQSGQTVSLIGWSMGGLYAYDAAMILPEQVREVITLGSPFGDIRGTSTFKLMRFLNRSKVPIEQQDFDQWQTQFLRDDSAVPVTILYSDQDGIVAPDSARLGAKQANHIHVVSSHMGFAFNDEVYMSIAKVLAKVTDE